MKELENSMNKHMVSYANIADYKSPTIIIGPSRRLDIVIVDVNKLYFTELSVGFGTRITINAERKKRKYEQLCNELRNNYDEVELR